MSNIFEYKDCITNTQGIESINIYGRYNNNSKATSFTIAIPTYKRVKTLGEAINSALNQLDYNDYNIIVVDNNPERNDDTEIFMQSYKENLRITYYKNSVNVGMAGNWNKCITLANSNNVILLHDDDVISPFALFTFSKVLKQMKRPWSLIKPQLIKFADIEELNFQKLNRIIVHKRYIYDFWGGDCIGAPTIILFNKEVYLKTGGACQDYFPSIDYALYIKLNRECSTYSIDVLLGGYRVGMNESLSKSTMDGFFDSKMIINEQIRRHYHIPSFIYKSILSHRTYHDYSYEKAYYNYPSYTLDLSKYNLYDNNLWLKIFNKFFNNCILRVLRRINRYTVTIDND